jgi:hypothetical protein
MAMASVIGGGDVQSPNRDVENMMPGAKTPETGRNGNQPGNPSSPLSLPMALRRQPDPGLHAVLLDGDVANAEILRQMHHGLTRQT